MDPYLTDPDVTLWHGSALAVLREMPDESIHCAVTSPPFWGLRSYLASNDPAKGEEIGSETSVDEWVAKLVVVFRELRRVLRSDGVFWLECGDSYASGETGRRDNGRMADDPETWKDAMVGQAPRKERRYRRPDGLKPKDLVLQPFLLAMALRADGWWLRGRYPWIKRNAMPESVRDRFTTAHSDVFQFTKAARYFFDADAVREPAEWARWGDQTTTKYEGTDTATGWMRPRTKSDLQAHRGRGYAGRLEPYTAAPAPPQEEGLYVNPGNRSGNGPRGRTDERRGFDERLELVAGKNHRSYIDIPTVPNGLAICETCGAYWERGAPVEHCGQPVTAHYAAFPPALAELCILSSTSEHGVCAKCGAPWSRIAEYDLTEGAHGIHATTPARADGVDEGSRSQRFSRDGFVGGQSTTVTTHGWEPACTCGAETIPAVVLDPFAGSGTSLLRARELGRRSVGIELRRAYCEITARRLAQQSLLTA